MNETIEWETVRPPGGEGGYEVSRFPVTVAQFRRFLEGGGYGRRELWSDRGWTWREARGFDRPAYWGETGYDRDELPVTGISFWEAEAFARSAAARLPSEHEWHRIASGFGARRYPWGDEAPRDGESRANLGFFGAEGEAWRTPVDRFPDGRSPEGVWDLLGNVSEWCLPADAGSIDDGARFGVLRGGCSWHTVVAVDNTFRDEVGLDTRDNQTGIRLVRALPGGAPIAAEPARPERSPAGPRRRRPIARPTRPFRQEGVPEELDADWRLEVGGEVERPLSLDLDTLRNDLPRSTDHGLFVCVCRWGELNRFAGVALRDLVERVRPTRPAEELYLLQRSVPGPDGAAYESWVSLAEALDHGALLCYEMDGEPLTRELGWPLRLIDLHLYGYKAVKCLGELRFVTEFRAGWWETERQYDPHGLVQPGRITVVGEAPYARDLPGTGRVELTAEEAAG